ncbi:hypothetical protein B0H14DRAFT_3440196 [Mycena olivaceomarginata]|nr:hypothetical protein B0H14DRAFT_3440196 [Mycena olivaceomarginata]
MASKGDLTVADVTGTLPDEDGRKNGMATRHRSRITTTLTSEASSSASIAAKRATPAPAAHIGRLGFIGFHDDKGYKALIKLSRRSGPFEADDPAPRAVSEAFDVVCPRRERRYIDTRDVKPAVNQAPGIEVVNHWQALLRDAPQRCIEIVPASRKETFDLSPISRLSAALPLSLPPSTVTHTCPSHGACARRTPAPRNPFQCMLALRLRRGDYEGHCRGMTYINLVFYSLNLFPHLPDHFVSDPDVPRKDERFLTRCWPDVAGVVKKVVEACCDYLTHATSGNRMHGDATLDVMYLLTNETLGKDGGRLRRLRTWC